jgi:hypothetical protein
MSESETGQSGDSWWEIPPAPAKIPWTEPELRSPDDWADRGNYPVNKVYSSIGLRWGLVATLDRATGEGGDFEVESEQQLLGLAIYLLTDMVQGAEAQFVWLIAEARNKGVSWAEIGAALGISRQAAHKRFAKEVAAIIERMEKDA